jgi:hypothetical protein
MAKAQRILSEAEVTEQIRVSTKKEILAYLKDGVPRSKKVDDAIELWKLINTEQHTKQAALNRLVNVLRMLPPNERLAEINKTKKLLLPEPA